MIFFKYLDDLVFELKKNNLILQIHGNIEDDLNKQLEFIKKLEYILTKYYENEYSDEDIEKMALFYIINTYENKFYYYSDKNANEIINVLITHIKEDKEDYSHDFGFNDHFIKKGDYHELAVALMESYNDTIIDNNISDNLEEIDSMGEICIFTIFTIVYIYFIFKFTFLNLFDKNTYAKSIIKYAIIIFSIYVSNIIVCIIFEKVINSFEYYQSFNLANIEDYGTFD